MRSWLLALGLTIFGVGPSATRTTSASRHWRDQGRSSRSRNMRPTATGPPLLTLLRSGFGKQR